jgi:hypothetical protein
VKGVFRLVSVVLGGVGEYGISLPAVRFEEGLDDRVRKERRGFVLGRDNGRGIFKFLSG